MAIQFSNECHSRCEESGTGRFQCLHPQVHVRNQSVTNEICALCNYWRQAPPREMRTPLKAALKYWLPRTVAVVIPCHNYGRYLADAVKSVVQQTRRADEILIVDDASDDDTPIVAAQFASVGVRYERVEFRHSQRTRQRGLELTKSDVVCFLDADDALAANYLAQGMARFERSNVGLVYSDVEWFGADQGRSSYPETCDVDLLARSNFLHTGCLVQREALQISQALEIQTDDRHTLQDWQLWRRILADGWQARKQTGLYRYRKHDRSMLAGWKARPEGQPTYFQRAGLAQETVTLFVPLSGRIALWPAMAGYLDRQTWPRHQVRLVLFDTSREPSFGKTVKRWIAECDYVDVRYLAVTVGAQSLADLPRATVMEQVTLAMTRIYNRMAQEASTQYVWVLEDDITPPDDACRRLLSHMDQDTASVSGVYWSRFAKAWVVWNDEQRMQSMAGEGVQEVGGNGFGCVMLRRLAIKVEVFTATIDIPAYDNAFYYRLPLTGMKAKVDWSVVCDHHGATIPIRSS